MPIPQRTYTVGGASNYRYGFNGQEMSNEIKGFGNSYTAEFWEYDSRLGRRWNIDPKPTVGISDYSVFANSPIINFDLLGDSPSVAKPTIFDYAKATTYIFANVVERSTTQATNAMVGVVRNQLVSIGGFSGGAVNSMTFGLVPVTPFGTNGYTQSDLNILQFSSTAGSVFPMAMNATLPPAAAPQLAPVNLKPLPSTGLAPSLIPFSVDFKGAQNEHHPHPVSLGGDPKQATVTLKQPDHVDLHRELNSFLKSIHPELAPRKGNSGPTIVTNFGIDAVRKALAAFYKSPIGQGQFKDAADAFFKMYPKL